MTVSGRVVNPLLMDPNDIHIGDIAHALSHIVRFTGHCPQPYTVAQHSVLVSYLVNPVYAREALLHDAAEAYISDLNKPVKSTIKAYRDIEEDLLRAILQKYELCRELPKAVVEADAEAFRLEVLRFFPHSCPLWREYKLSPKEYIDSKVKIAVVLDHQDSKMAFLRRYEELFEADFLPIQTN